MNIPLSSIEPFGYTGIPTLYYKTGKILAALEQEVKNISDPNNSKSLFSLVETIKEYHGYEINTYLVDEGWKITFELPFTNLKFAISIPTK